MTARLLLVCLVAVLASSDGRAHGAVIDHGFAPRLWPDAREGEPGASVDLRRVSFGQRDTKLWLRLRTQGTWSAGGLAEEGLCLVLVRAGRLCVGGDGRGAAVLRFRPAGAPGFHAIRAVVLRRDERSLFARFHRRAIGLEFGRARWFVESGGGADRAPDRGTRVATVGALGQPACFGAAARAGAKRCVNRVLRRMVVPSPARAVVSPDAPCRRVGGVRFVTAEPCEFGYRDEQQPVEVGLIGDSHSAHWRAAVEVVAQARAWRAVSITHPGCSFSTEVYPAPAPIPARCRRHSREALRWLREHPSVHTVFTSSSAGRGFGAGGFLAMWRRLPPTVRRIHVIRDVPRARPSTAGCVLRVRRRRARSGRACAIPRAAATLADPSATAARRRGDRARLVDLTRHFCDAASCFPVVGGAYVYKDDNHMNTVFATTLGPFLLRHLR